MKQLIELFVKYLEENSTKENVETLKTIGMGDFVNVKEAFELGRALQSVYELETETSNTGLDEDEIGEVIEYVQNNIEQAKY